MTPDQEVAFRSGHLYTCDLLRGATTPPCNCDGTWGPTAEAIAKRAQLIDAMGLLGWTVGGTPELPVFTRVVPTHPFGSNVVSIRRDYAGWVFQWAEGSHYVLFGYTCGSIPGCLDELLKSARNAAYGYGL